MTRNNLTQRNRPIDMSSDAIDRRLRDLAGLYRLGMSIKEAVYIGPVEDIQSADAAQQVSDESPRQAYSGDTVDESPTEGT